MLFRYGENKMLNSTVKEPVNNVTVICTGATANQNGSDGYGTNTNTDTGNTYNISLRRLGHGNKRRPDLQYLGNGQ